MKKNVVKMSVPKEIVKAVEVSPVGPTEVNVDHIPHIILAQVLLEQARQKTPKT